jgi:hypothetical protein
LPETDCAKSQSPIAHIPEHSQVAQFRNPLPRKPVESAQQSVNAARCHQVPSTLQRWEPGEIVGSLRAGRNVAQTSKEYHCTAAVALELWLRDVERRLTALARPVAALGCLLMGVAVADAWEAAAGHSGPVVERAFGRNGRARKRGLEDGHGLIELRQVTGIAA